MAKFCGKCGARLNEQTGRCPNCDAADAIINAVQTRVGEDIPIPAAQPMTQIKRQTGRYCCRCGTPLDSQGWCRSCGWTAGGAAQKSPVTGNIQQHSPHNVQRIEEQPFRKEAPEREDHGTRVLVRLICVVAALIVLLAVAVGVLVYFDVMDIPAVSEFYHTIGLKPDKSTDRQEPTSQPQLPSAEPEQDGTVQAPYTQQKLELVSSGNTATLTLSEWQKDGTWLELCSVPAHIGKNGVTWNKQEGDMATPAGEFDILYYLGTVDRHSKLTYTAISDGDVWVSDPDSAFYNTLQRNSGSRDWDSAQAENLYRKFHDDYSAACIMFGYNGDGLHSGTAVSGRGSDIFIDGVGARGNLTSGYGDIKITASDMLMLLGYLDSDKHPTLSIS